MLLTLAKRLLLEPDKKCLWKLAWNMGLGGMLSVERHKRRLRRGEVFPPFLYVSVINSCNLRCQGCWVDVAHKQHIIDRTAFAKLVREAKEMGNVFFGVVGGEPFMHPELLDMLGGVVLSGGGDVDPARYGQQPDSTVIGVSANRDSYELSVIEMTMARELPLLLICRGLQVFNVAMGGTLIQDIPITGPLHSQRQPRHEATHAVRVSPGSQLSQVLGSERVITNSMHHQAMDGPGEGIVPVAWAEDSVVEGFEMPGYGGWLLGVQWHPEELTPGDGASEALFAAFLAAAADYRARTKT